MVKSWSSPINRSQTLQNLIKRRGTPKRIKKQRKMFLNKRKSDTALIEKNIKKKRRKSKKKARKSSSSSSSSDSSSNSDSNESNKSEEDKHEKKSSKDAPYCLFEMKNRDIKYGKREILYKLIKLELKNPEELKY